MLSLLPTLAPTARDLPILSEDSVQTSRLSILGGYHFPFSFLLSHFLNLLSPILSKASLQTSRLSSSISSLKETVGPSYFDFLDCSICWEILSTIRSIYTATQVCSILTSIISSICNPFPKISSPSLSIHPPALSN